MLHEQCTGGGWTRETQSHGECTEAKREAYCWIISASVCACMLSPFSPVWLFATLWTVACQAPLSLGFSRQEYWSGLPCSSPGDLLSPGIKPEFPGAPAFQMSFFFFLTTEPPGNPSWIIRDTHNQYNHEMGLISTSQRISSYLGHLCSFY